MCFRPASAWLAPWILSACANVGTPRVGDAPAPTEVFQSLRREEPSCHRPVALLPANEPTGRKFREIARVSVTCYPGALSLCDRRLREAACRLGADAVIAMKPSGRGIPPGTSPLSLVGRSGRAIRYEGD